MKKSPEDYRQAAQERIDQAEAEFNRKAFGLAMYLAGVAVECTFRAYIKLKVKDTPPGNGA